MHVGIKTQCTSSEVPAKNDDMNAMTQHANEKFVFYRLAVLSTNGACTNKILLPPSFLRGIHKLQGRLPSTFSTRKQRMDQLSPLSKHLPHQGE